MRASAVLLCAVAPPSSNCAVLRFVVAFVAVVTLASAGFPSAVGEALVAGAPAIAVSTVFVGWVVVVDATLAVVVAGVAFPVWRGRRHWLGRRC